MLALKKKFAEIKIEGWHRVTRASTGDIGTYFEKKLGISNNSFSVPDYEGIEIKVKSSHSDYPINLFSLTCDGPNFFELKRFVDRFGICDKDYPNSKILSIRLSNAEYSAWGRYLKMKLYIDYHKKKIFILVANANGKIIEKKSYWDFSSIEEAACRKLNYLCYVQADIIYSRRVKYVYYHTIHFYKLKGFDAFLRMLQDGTITICIKYGVYKKGNRKGTPFDHGTAFLLPQDKIGELFDSLDI